MKYEFAETAKMRVKEALRARGMTQKELCERTGIPKASMSQYVNGHHLPKQDSIYLISSALRVRPDWLMGLDVPMDEPPVIEFTQPVESIRIPLLGKVAAGSPIYSSENVEGELMADGSLSDGRNMFALRVKGDSMTPQILDRDIIIVREQEEVDDGDIVVATVNGGEGCVKRLKKYQNAISLVSMNPEYEPMYFTAEAIDTMPVRIWGKVVEIRRSI